MLIEATAFFLAVSILFYCLFAGADFGAGILEAFRGENRRGEQRELITRAISPVWEANHVWLILAVVVLFVGFPRAYARASVTFHIPLTIMLLGVVLRGCAFTFRHYDAVKDRLQNYYSAVFVVSSFLTPFMLGTVAGGVFLGRFPRAPLSFKEGYIDPWLNLFSFSVGLFTGVLFAFLASVYLVGETADDSLKAIFKTRARAANFSAIAAGLLVFAAAEADGLPLASMFLSDAFASACMALATLLLWPLRKSLRGDRVQLARILAAVQVALVLLGWFKLQFPALIVSRLAATESLTIYNSAAPESVLKSLLGALLVGSVFIFPALFYLMRIFKRRAGEAE